MKCSVTGLCWYEKDNEHEQYEEISSDGPDDGLTDVETPSQTVASKSAMPLTSQPIDDSAKRGG